MAFIVDIGRGSNHGLGITKINNICRNIIKTLHTKEFISNFAAFSGMRGSERAPHFILISSI